jgi:hypothetical protein
MDVDGYEHFRILLFVILLLINGLMTWDMGINWLDLMIAETANDTIFEHFLWDMRHTVDICSYVCSVCTVYFWLLAMTSRLQFFMLLGFLQVVQWKESCARKKNSHSWYSAW